MAHSPAAAPADPAIYTRLREHALTQRQPGLAPGAVGSVLMDWHTSRGPCTALATADGTASIYLASGGGFLNGGHRFPAIRTSAEHAVSIATTLLPSFSPTASHALPPPDTIAFFLVTGTALLHAAAPRASIESSTSPLAPLAAGMQAVITAYRNSLG